MTDDARELKQVLSEEFKATSPPDFLSLPAFFLASNLGLVQKANFS